MENIKIKLFETRPASTQHAKMMKKKKSKKIRNVPIGKYIIEQQFNDAKILL